MNHDNNARDARNEREAHEQRLTLGDLLRFRPVTDVPSETSRMNYDDNEGREGNLIEGVINAMRIISHIALWIIAIYLLAGCSHVRPLAEYQHVSHASDGLGGPGFDTLSLGIRWRPVKGVTVDLLEGYSPNKLDDRHEIFTGRVQVEF